MTPTLLQPKTRDEILRQETEGLIRAGYTRQEAEAVVKKYLETFTQPKPNS